MLPGAAHGNQIPSRNRVLRLWYESSGESVGTPVPTTGQPTFSAMGDRLAVSNNGVAI
ncbi:MAG: hypothetical protein SGI86_19990 [Deltaproteobacteria bacterium]|nr:hypothetical protein [Deltaproteobacteria bacterium]